MTTKLFTFKNKLISYSIEGQGSPLVLLHGYQSDSRVWNDLIPLLTDRYQLIIPDLPGHGCSDLVEEVNTMELMANVVLAIANELGLTKISVAGHSMGGYVALAMAEITSELIDQVFLINSHPFADSEKRIKDRKREISLINDGKKKILIRNFTHLNFALNNKEKLQEKINETIFIGLSQADDGIYADLKGLMVRKNRVALINNQTHNVTIIYGQDEEKFPREEVQKLASKRTVIQSIPNCSHMSIIEQPKALAEILLR